jgi:hypothetical protein
MPVSTGSSPTIRRWDGLRSPEHSAAVRARIFASSFRGREAEPGIQFFAFPNKKTGLFASLNPYGASLRLFCALRACPAFANDEQKKRSISPRHPGEAEPGIQFFAFPNRILDSRQ